MKLLNYLTAVICLSFVICCVIGSDLNVAEGRGSNDKLNCSRINCPMIPSLCPSGEKLFIENCCPSCVNCNDHQCPKEIKCETGTHPIKDSSYCCEHCVKCNTLLCPRIAIHCDKGYHPAVPVNKCCTECVKCPPKDECPLINCITGSELYTPPNTCCPTCRLMNQSEPTTN